MVAVVTLVRRWRTGPRSPNRHDDPVASKELIRQLRQEAGGGVGVRPSWLLRSVGIFTAFLIGVPLVIAGLVDGASASRSVSDIAYLLVGAGFTWLAVWLVRLNRRKA
jgi:hypothetical protein